ncbi:HAMP domain-containing sensor histidine kinase, partial [Pseudomonas sp. MWU12-2323]|uniref:HAMP domain-containing sensor histidine kinase n=1 Tax=Pseudomonas sp. MWU12-2323 TaxID=2651296 RepID=UPI0013817B40
DYHQRLSVNVGDELAELSSTFNHMSERLEELQHLESQLRRRDRLHALGEVAMGLAHEIRNPLAAIHHAADLLAEDETDPARQRLIRIVQGNSTRINHLVQEVLALNRRDRIKPEPIRLQPFLDELLDHFGMVEAAAAGAVRCVCQQQAAAVQFDRGHFGQILNNLLANAWRYSSKQPGAVRIEVASV